MANTNLTNQRQVFVEEYVRSGDHLEAANIFYCLRQTIYRNNMIGRVHTSY